MYGDRKCISGYLGLGGWGMGVGVWQLRSEGFLFEGDKNVLNLR